MLCGFDRLACKHRGCEAGLKHWGWVCAFGSCFSVVLLVVRSSGFVLLVVLFVVRASVRAFGRSFRGSFRGSFFCSFFWSFFLWFVLLGARMCFLFDALKFLEACVARSEVS